MALLVTLVELTPHRMRYRILQDDDKAPDPDTVVIRNRDVAPAAGIGDLRFNSRPWHGFPISNLVSQTVVNISDARRLMEGDGDTTRPSAIERIRSHMYLTPLSSNNNANWSVDCDAGTVLDPPSGEHVCLLIAGPTGQDNECWLDIHFTHSKWR